MFIKFIEKNNEEHIIEICAISKSIIDGQIYLKMGNGNELPAMIVKNIAYLMNNEGKTIEAYHGRDYKLEGNSFNKDIISN